ncbi:amino acid/amide ABC transporter membrane protein 2 (HAAT family) /amino acid/amide ABC transporter ATP-binding protein 1 (HAAT family) [Humitalea rosea]|uniref:Amino acid/amide ABC transporter membrane protein 2 (HAAT family) /amino acid/amide ABC transporter ATP-binding protein 1 (HAAT family) n=1 Tax=Humitalea rosea TaxID=990373 RepID=A0A2W7HYT7_9PROT|nr:branched-chain amino acid ABC transporter ATP-binding protein/permease [Humitalea rosea]PZW37838.1 amino acid/amide ABC transporter membrane protein 2 (HAAT family) /amino acid/amide ABC transporter ATP-binding protein 1 (HAAT family) [Humitalea rosea]
MTALRAPLSRIVANPWAQAGLALLLLLGCYGLSSGTVQILSFVLIGIIFAQSINLLTGLAGQISLGHAGFFGIGAYGAGILAKTHGLDVALGVPCAMLLAAAAGWLLSFPAGRVKDVYLAMMTLGFGMIFFEVVREWSGLTGGTMGLPGVPSPTLRTLRILGVKLDGTAYFQLLLAITALVLLLMRNLTQSRIGRAFFAIHTGEVGAGSIGIPPGSTKRLAYALSGALAGLAGGLYAHLVGYLGPESFGLTRSIEVLVMAIVGGLGSIAGQVLSVTLFTFLPERLQVFAEYQFIVYGLILTFSLVVLPRGIGGLLLEPARFIRPRALRAAAALPAALPPAEGGGVLEVTGVTMRFGGLVALNDVSLTLAPGRITALIGPNGSGKSTLVNVISGLYRPSAGRVVFAGHDITGLADHQVAAARVVRTFQDPRLVPHFTVRENLLLGAHRLQRHSALAALLGLPAAIEDEARHLATIEAVMALTNLTEVADRVMATLPYGTRRMAEVGRALLAHPLAVLLDEPAAGLSEAEMERLAQVIRDMKAMGLAILLIEHHMDFLDDLVDDVVVLDSGRVIYRGDIAGMRCDREVIAAYLGTEETVDA